MFENFKISGIKGLKECYLLNLGKINVICGKNNSGKSTVLEGIERPSTYGKQFKDEDVDNFFKETIHALYGISEIHKSF
jgi:predicted ATPase